MSELFALFVLRMTFYNCYNEYLLRNLKNKELAFFVNILALCLETLNTFTNTATLLQYVVVYRQIRDLDLPIFWNFLKIYFFFQDPEKFLKT